MRGRVIWLRVLFTVTNSSNPHPCLPRLRPPPLLVQARQEKGRRDQGRRAERTFWEQTTVAVNQVFAQEPPIAKLVVPLDQFDAVTLCQGQLIGASGSEVICKWCASDKLAHGD